MRLSIVLLFLAILVSAYTQEAATMVEEEEETVAAASALKAEGELNLDALLEEADQTIDAVADTETEAADTTTASSSTEEEEATGEVEQVEATEAAPTNETTDTTGQQQEEEQQQQQTVEQQQEQSGPFVDLFGPQLYSLQMIDETQAQLIPQYTNDALKGKKVVGVYFSADWCGPCRKFTPELVSFYDKMNKRRGHKDDFEIVWVSRCKDVQSYGQYFTHMKWLALPPEDAMGQRGQMLSEKFKVKGIPSLTLLDDLGNIITTDARNKIPQDKAGIGFPWRNPLVQLYTTIFPRSLRLMVKDQVDTIKGKLVQRVKGLVGMKSKALEQTFSPIEHSQATIR